MPLPSRPVALTAAAATLAALAAGTTVATAAKAPAKASVTLKNTKFGPAKVTIRKGGTVTWTWRDGSTPHDVVGPGFRSKVVTAGTFRHRFAKAGTFRYICSIHPGMKGTVTVR